MKLMLKIKIIPLVLLSMLLGSCNDWLDVEPVGVQTNKTFWQTKEEVEGVLMASYIQLRKSQDNMLMWGELRGDGLKFGPGFKNQSAEEIDRSNIRELEILPTNRYSDYAELYKGISYANHVIKLGPGAMDYDVTFTEPLMNSYLAEAVFLRSLYYFYLVRAFRDVPYVKEPYDTDELDYRVAKTSGDSILKDVLVDLKKYSTKCKPGYEVAWQTKGRATSWAFYALIADISLWVGDYDTAIEYCTKLESGSFELGEMEDWMEVYYPGNSKESIFELQYDHKDLDQRNKLMDLAQSGDGILIISEHLNDLFLAIDLTDLDVRGYDWGYSNVDKKMWKYIGTKTNVMENGGFRRPSDESSPNFIFYRYAEIIFIKAEALIMKSEANIDQAFTLLDETIRKRAGYRKPITRPSNQADAIRLIVDERLKEFYGEGKSWFDILRVSRVDGVGVSYLKDCLLPHVPTNKRQIKNNDLNDVDSHYLPLHEKEIRAANGVLIQNPFYKKYTDNI